MPRFPALPQAITSFGAARTKQAIYIYGGHHGIAHHYYDLGQSGDLLRLDLADPQKWEVVDTGPRLQGLALCAHGEQLYRLGGFAARNSQDEEQNLWSLPDVARFDIASGKWESLPDMPEPRSSFDAAILESTLYVVGGWAMAGDREATWLDSAYACDLSQTSPVWRAVAPPGFQRRALAVGAAGGKLIAVGGMQQQGEVSRQAAIYDPRSDTWSTGPELPGEEMEGFGPAAAVLNDELFVSTSSGHLWQLPNTGDAWEPAGTLQDARFFHRMVSLDDGQFALLGGASMQRGKYDQVEVIQPVQ